MRGRRRPGPGVDSLEPLRASAPASLVGWKTVRVSTMLRAGNASSLLISSSGISFVPGLWWLPRACDTHTAARVSAATATRKARATRNEDVARGFTGLPTRSGTDSIMTGQSSGLARRCHPRTSRPGAHRARRRAAAPTSRAAAPGSGAPGAHPGARRTDRARGRGWRGATPGVQESRQALSSGPRSLGILSWQRGTNTAATSPSFAEGTPVEEHRHGAGRLGEGRQRLRPRQRPPSRWSRRS